jgi:hypothetical protein
MKPLDQFAWRRRTQGQRDNYCRPCRADYRHEHYVANRAKYIEATARRKANVAIKRTAFLAEYFVAHPASTAVRTI